jgi:hypothetical protein
LQLQLWSTPITVAPRTKASRAADRPEFLACWSQKRQQEKELEEQTYKTWKRPVKNLALFLGMTTLAPTQVRQ